MNEKSAIFISAVAAISADGCIADQHGNQTILTNAADRLHLKQQMEKADALVVGRKTYQEFASALKHFRCLVASSRDLPIVDLPERHQIWNPATRSFAELASQLELHSICVLGGAQVYTTFLKESLLDELLLTISPAITLAPSGLPLFLNCAGNIVQKLHSSELGFDLVQSKTLSGFDERPDSPKILRFSRQLLKEGSDKSA